MPQQDSLTELYLDTGEKPESRELWEEAFPEDSRSFDDYYFREKLKKNRILALKDRGRIVSMIHLNPYCVQVKNRRWRVDYLVGVATRADSRHRGHMRRLLRRMMADMRAEEMPFCFLMPADEAIYRPFGFTYIFRQPQWGWKPGMRLVRRELLPWKDSLGSRRYLEELAAWMTRWLSRRYQVYTVRDAEYMQGLLREIASENGSFDVLYDGNDMIGVESEWGLEKREPRLLYAEPAYVQEKAAAKPAIMARIITAEAFVRAVCLREHDGEDVRRLCPDAVSAAADVGAKEEICLRLRLRDPLVAENDGLWLWRLNRETSWLERTADGSAETDGADRQQELELTITELTEWLFGYRVPEAAEPYAKLVQTLDGVFLDEIV